MFNNFKIQIILLRKRISLKRDSLVFLGFILAFSLLSGCMCGGTTTDPTVPTTSSITITNQTFNVDENVSNGALVNTVNTSDNSNVSSFTITTGNTNNAFAINSNGQLTTLSDIDYGTTSNYSLNIEALDTAGIKISAIVTVNVNDLVDEWSVRYFSNNTTNDRTAEATNLGSTPISPLSNKMFVWLDASAVSLLKVNTNGRLTNWIDRNSFRIAGTNVITSISLTTNTTAEMTNGELVGFTNIYYSNDRVIVLSLTSEVPTTPKSDLANNDSLAVFAGTNGYVTVDYQGNDRVGFQIETTSMDASDSVRAFYLVTSLVGGYRGQGEYVPLGYSSNLSSGKRFLTRASGSGRYLTGRGNTGTGKGVGRIVLGDSTHNRDRDFDVPSGIHLLSRRGLNISKSALGGVLGTFPTSGNQGAGQNIRELIFFTNEVTDEDHSNVVRYLLEKWNIPREPVTNLYSDYSSKGINVLQNAVDGALNTYFQGNNSHQYLFTNGTILFEAVYYPSVLNSAQISSLVRGLSTSNYSIYLKTGNNVNSDTIKAPFKVEVLRTNSDQWHTLTNITANTNDGSKTFYSFLLDKSNDFIGYRMVATAGASIFIGNFLTIDEFRPGIVTPNSPRVLSFFNTIPRNRIYLTNTNRTIFSSGFTNYLRFDQNVYGLKTNDFTVANGTLVSVMNTSGNSNYTLVIRPHSFSVDSSLLHTSNLILSVSLRESGATNILGYGHNGVDLIMNFAVWDPFADIALTNRFGGRPTFADLDADGDLDLILGYTFGYFRYFRNTGDATNAIYSEQIGSANPLNGFGGGDINTIVFPAFGDIDGDGDLDMVSGKNDGLFRFYRNTGNISNATFSEQTGSANPLNGFDAGSFSTPTLGDIDEDGDLDMLSGEAHGRFFFYRNDGTMSNAVYSEHKNISLGSQNPFINCNNAVCLRDDVGFYSTPTFVDFDGDNDLDMVSGAANGYFRFYSNNGSGDFIDQGNISILGILPEVPGISHPAFGDLDGDGDLDMVSSSTVEGLIHFINISGGRYRIN